MTLFKLWGEPKPKSKQQYFSGGECENISKVMLKSK